MPRGLHGGQKHAKMAPKELPFGVILDKRGGLWALRRLQSGWCLSAWPGLERFWLPRGLQNSTKNGPEITENGVGNSPDLGSVSKRISSAKVVSKSRPRGAVKTIVVP